MSAELIGLFFLIWSEWSVTCCKGSGNRGRSGERIYLLGLDKDTVTVSVVGCGCHDGCTCSSWPKPKGERLRKSHSLRTRLHVFE
jgi:hypothetical protein